jgi:hypothetical protein
VERGRMICRWNRTQKKRGGEGRNRKGKNYQEEIIININIISS